MLNCFDEQPCYVKITDIMHLYGNDLRAVDLRGVKLFGDLRAIRLPDDVELFQGIYDKNISGVKMPDADYSRYNFNDVSIIATKFTKTSVLPEDINLFQIIREKNLFGTTLPEGDYSSRNFSDVVLSSTKFTRRSVLPKERDFFVRLKVGIQDVLLPSMDYSGYSFSGVDLVGTIFPKDAKLPSEVDLFQGILDKDLSYAVLPEVDFSKYNFKNVRMVATKFRRKSRLPENYSFFRDLAYFDKRIKLPNNVWENIHFYDIEYMDRTLICKLDMDKKYLILNRIGC